MKRILVVFGTRPEAIKLAPVIWALRRRGDEAELAVCSTAQHGEMLNRTLASLELDVDFDLQVMRPHQHLTDLLGRLLRALRPVLDEVRPDVVVAQGDTTTVLGAALAGFAAGARLGHVEAGLRTHEKRLPFPEEANRRLVTVLADDHFAPTPSARDTLLAEGVPPEHVFLTGNTGIDALRWMTPRVQERPLPAGLELAGRRLVLVTAHRRESFGKPLREICHALREIVEAVPDADIVYPVHLNPQVAGPVHEMLHGRDRIHLIDPVDYADLVTLLSRSHLVLTDSGGIQEEAPALGKPVIVLRKQTERPEAIAAGVATLAGTDRETIARTALRILTNASVSAAMARSVDVYGDGGAAERIAEVLIEGTMRLPPFQPVAEERSPAVHVT